MLEVERSLPSGTTLAKTMYVDDIVIVSDAVDIHAIYPVIKSVFL